MAGRKSRTKTSGILRAGCDLAGHQGAHVGDRKSIGSEARFISVAAGYGSTCGSHKSRRYGCGAGGERGTAASVYSWYGIVDSRELWRFAKNFGQRLGRAGSQVRRSDLRV